MHAVYKHAYLNTLLFLNSAFLLCMVKMHLKGVVGGRVWKLHLVIMENNGKVMELCF